MHQQVVSRDPTWIAYGQVPSLDGLRAVSILLVLWNHIALNFSRGWPYWLKATRDTGSIGVDVFFIISGFLITILLQREKNQSGTLCISSFYIRRFLRIVPAYCTYIIVVGGLLSFTSSRLLASEWVRLATYSVSLWRLPSWYVAHAWSLSVEEHFYLIWPLLILLFPRGILLVIAGGYSFAAIGIRLALFRCSWFPVDREYFTLTRADAIAAGCFLALFATSPHRRLLYFSNRCSLVLFVFASSVLVAAYVMHSALTRLGVLFHAFLYRFVIEWCLVLVVWLSIYRSRSLVGLFLNARITRALGILSYSIYLWQEPFLGPIQATRAFCLPWNLFLTFLVASTSFLLVERPCLRLRRYFRQEQSASEATIPLIA